tara:strand:- start:35083 stop:35958 length:876 start_codon:yes stop_codon:yes gene_type:complete
MLSDQSKEKKWKIFKDALQFQESAAGVAIQKVPSSYLLRILKPLLDARDAAPNEDAANRINAMDHCPDRRDPLIHAIYSMDATFRSAVTKGVDPLSSAEGIASEHKVDGTKGNGCLFLAWKTTYNTNTRTLDTPMLVGAMTVYKFKRTTNFSTNAASTGMDDATLNPFYRSNFIYIDTLVSSSAGVGKILALHAYRYAIMKKAKGVIALSYSRKRLTGTAKPESYRIFHDLGFTHLIERANYTIQMYGTWFATLLDDVAPLSGVLDSGIRLCTRSGFTKKTEDQLVWRCPR